MLKTPVITLILLALVAATAFPAEPTDPAELSALRKELDRRRTDALRPISTWYESELDRLERSLTARGNLDGALAVRAEREQSRAEQAMMSPGAFKAALEDTRWRFNADENLQIVLKKDGFIECGTWTRLGFAHRWQVSGPNTVTYTVVRGPSAVGKQGSLVFAPDLKSFAGTTPDGNKIAPSPRVK
jgi:hypothetical protein